MDGFVPEDDRAGDRRDGTAAHPWSALSSVAPPPPADGPVAFSQSVQTPVRAVERRPLARDMPSADATLSQLASEMAHRSPYFANVPHGSAAGGSSATVASRPGAPPANGSGPPVRSNEATSLGRSSSVTQHSLPPAEDASHAFRDATPWPYRGEYDAAAAAAAHHGSSFFPLFSPERPVGARGEVHPSAPDHRPHSGPYETAVRGREADGGDGSVPPMNGSQGAMPDVVFPEWLAFGSGPPYDAAFPAHGDVAAVGETAVDPRDDVPDRRTSDPRDGGVPGAGAGVRDDGRASFPFPPWPHPADRAKAAEPVPKGRAPDGPGPAGEPGAGERPAPYRGSGIPGATPEADEAWLGAMVGAARDRFADGDCRRDDAVRAQRDPRGRFLPRGSRNPGTHGVPPNPMASIAGGTTYDEECGGGGDDHDDGGPTRRWTDRDSGDRSRVTAPRRRPAWAERSRSSGANDNDRAGGDEGDTHARDGMRLLLDNPVFIAALAAIATALVLVAIAPNFVLRPGSGGGRTSVDPVRVVVISAITGAAVLLMPMLCAYLGRRHQSQPHPRDDRKMKGNPS